jgi:hypothetical protein
MAEPIWRCQGCGAPFVAGQEDMIIEHVRDCDYVDGAGNPVSRDERENQRLTGLLSWLPAKWHSEVAAALTIAYGHGWRDATASLEATDAERLEDAIEQRDEEGEPPNRRPYLTGRLLGIRSNSNADT